MSLPGRTSWTESDLPIAKYVLADGRLGVVLGIAVSVGAVLVEARSRLIETRERLHLHTNVVAVVELVLRVVNAY